MYTEPYQDDVSGCEYSIRAYKEVDRVRRKVYLRIKRILDILLALILLIPAGIIVAACYIAIKIETKGPAFFVQQRPGKNKKTFSLYKLRTMTVETERDGVPLSDTERLTKTGRMIRACSFDELPQLWNILKGEMSFIGPRPLLVQYLPLYTPEQARRHEVFPGISGWAQVTGRNELTWEDKLKRDVWYVDHIGFGLDLKIFVMTLWNVLNRSGINAGRNETMQPFTGSVQNEE